MLIDPADFGLTAPLQVESLKVWFYWGMGSRADTVFTFKLHGGDGTTLLWESESLVAPITNWIRYGLPEPVTIDTGRCYIVATARSVDPYAHPYINIDDDSTPDHCFFGRPSVAALCSCPGRNRRDWLMPAVGGNAGSNPATTTYAPSHPAATSYCPAAAANG